MSKGIETTGTVAWVIKDGKPLEIACVTNISGLGFEREEIEGNPCLASGKAPTAAGGLTYKNVTLDLNLDTAAEGHEFLWERGTTSTKPLKFAVGLSDDDTPPTVVDDEFVLPTTRSWYKITGAVVEGEDTAAGNSFLESQVAIKPSDVQRIKRVIIGD